MPDVSTLAPEPPVTGQLSDAGRPGPRRRRRAGAPAGISVTVVVPVRDPAAPLDALVRALGRQGLADDAYEVIFVLAPGDGECAARVGRIAQRVPQAHVMSDDPEAVPPAAARGDWILVHGEYGQLTAGALRRLLDGAARLGVAALLGGDGSYRRLGAPGQRRVVAADLPLVDGPGGVALLRRDFLARQRLAVPLGADALARALLRAGEVGLLGGNPCYLRGRDVEPAPWEAADLLDVHDCDAFRLALLRSMVDWAAGASVLARADRFALLDGARQLINEELPDGLDARLPAATRVRCRLLREGRFADLVDCVRAEAAVRAEVTLTGAAWRAGALELDVLARLVAADGTPLAFAASGDLRLFPVPVRAVAPATRDAAVDLAAGAVEVLLHHGSTGESVALPTDVTVVRDHDGRHERVSFTARARLGPAAPDEDWALVAGAWTVRLRVDLCGLRREVDIPPPRRPRRWPPARLAPARTIPGGYRVSLTALDRVTARIRP
ncbi:hypothetical protein [Luedemannella helvata]|uniref:TarS/TarP linker domain-containing protein n=1 Tax=Luedemannella helvata TaxID=349315 RepID=A0ABP4WNG7_9ACTN